MLNEGPRDKKCHKTERGGGGGGGGVGNMTDGGGV